MFPPNLELPHDGGFGGEVPREYLIHRGLSPSIFLFREKGNKKLQFATGIGNRITAGAR